MTPLCKTSIAALGIWILCLAPAQAQTARDLTDHEPTTEELVEGLKLAAPPPASGQMRGIGPVSLSQPQKPQCDYYRKRTQTRGVQLGAETTPETPSVAIKVTFATDSAQLTPEATQTLNKLGQALQSQELASCCFQIEGHTDSVGTDAYNEGLSQRRAQSVAHYLAERHKLKDRTITVWYGEQKPIADNDTDEGRQKNRRVQVVNLGYGQVAEK
jgi:outer membrane protein OmpA-like peptidoglycan-associated protein